MGIYNFKEKQKHFNDLRNGNAVDVDIELLEKNQPQHPQIARFKKMPQRFTDEILYALLDFCSRDQVIKYRRDAEKKAADEEAEKQKAADEEAAKKAAEEEAAKKAADEEAEKQKAAMLTATGATTEDLETLKEEHSALQEEHEDLLSEHEEALAEKEELEETNQQLEKDLEKGKKKKLPKEAKA